MDSRKKYIEKIITFAYFVAILIITQFPVSLSFSYVGLSQINFNLIPFNFLVKSIIMLQTAVINGLPISSYIIPVVSDNSLNFILNILLFLPLSFLFEINSEKNTLKKVICSSFFISLILEIFQVIGMIFLLNSGRVFDIDDILANIMGGIIGFLLCKLSLKMIKRKSFKGSLNKPCI